jgi:flavin reductase (DIM6/NTAB) family NADH-FMN oxidoreductase RutF
MASNFETLPILDNFYQTSSFFPMPIVLVGTLDETGQTNLGSYSLCFPYYIAGKERYTMILLCRNSSNTAKNILRSKKCTLNFIPHDKKYLKNTVALGFPGETTAEKMDKSIFTLTEGMSQSENAAEKYPQIVDEAFQVFECTWDSSLDGAENDIVQEEYFPPFHNFNGITSPMGAHFILSIDRILMKPKYRRAIVEGVQPKFFPNVPVDYGYRDNTNFWMAKFKKPYAEKIPESKGINLNSITYAAERTDPEVKFTDEACAALTKVPRIFLKKILQDCVVWAKEREITLITDDHMKQIRDKRTANKA